MDRLGIAFSGGPNASEIVGLVKLAEDLGYASAWVAEGHGGDQFAVLSGCAVQTSTIGLGTVHVVLTCRPVCSWGRAAAISCRSRRSAPLGGSDSHLPTMSPLQSRS